MLFQENNQQPGGVVSDSTKIKDNKWSGMFGVKSLTMRLKFVSIATAHSEEPAGSGLKDEPK